MDEFYRYLGKFDDVHYLAHRVFNYKKFTSEINSRIINCLINNKLITSINERVVVYDITDKVDVIILIHKTSYDEDKSRDQKIDLSMYSKIMRQTHIEKYAIKYVYSNENRSKNSGERYEFFEINLKIKGFPTYPDDKINSVKTYLTIKPIE